MSTGLFTPGIAYRTKDPKVTGPGTIYTLLMFVVTNLQAWSLSNENISTKKALVALKVLVTWCQEWGMFM